MSKSKGNYYTLGDLVGKGYSPMAVRYALLAGHPRKQLNFTLDSLHAAESALNAIRGFDEALNPARNSKTHGDTKASALFDDVLSALRTDLNSPAALGALFIVINGFNMRKATRGDATAFDRVMHVLGFDRDEDQKAAPAEIRALAEKRWGAKSARDFASADALRRQLEAAGWSMLRRQGRAIAGAPQENLTWLPAPPAHRSSLPSMTPLEELRHSASHVLATALLRIYPDAKLDIGPPTDTGFYYDVDLDHKLTAEDLLKIEAEMKKVADENQPFLRKEVSRDEAAEIIKSRGQERYKLGRLADIPEGEKISFYQNGEFIDLCAGTHVRYTSKLKAFKLLSVAGAYHRGDEKNKQLQRIYGTAFPTKDELASYLEQVEQAKHRDHRKLGRDLKLFVIDEDVGQGLILWTPNGSIIRQELQNFISGELRKQGYSQVFTPHIGKLELYKISGHFPYYKESQFTPVVENESLARILHERLLLRRDGRPPGRGLGAPCGPDQRAHGQGDHRARPGEAGRPAPRRLHAEADELPAPHQDLRIPAPLLPRPARPPGRVRHGVPLGAVRRAERDDPRARLHPGRRPPLLHGGAGRPANCRAASPS